jgi:acetyl-CoA acyltransferase
MARRVAIIAGCRTPFARAGSTLKEMSGVQLGTVAVRELIHRAELDPAIVDHLIFGTVVPAIPAPNLAREVTLEAGLPPTVPAFTVSRACASSNQAITAGAEAIMLGHADVVIAGGAEVLSDVPMLLSRGLRDGLLAASRARSVGARVKALAAVRPRHFAPITPAIAEPSTGETMGESAERMAKENGISREAQDRWALRSHRLAAQGTADGRLTAEIVPTFVPPGYDTVVTSDNGIRSDTSEAQLAALKPVFDRKYGSVTAASASPLTDGAGAVLLMSEAVAQALGHEPLGYIRSWAYTALSPRDQLLQGPAYAVPLALDRAGMSMGDIELWEMHEAFAAQVLSNLQALDSDEFARTRLDRAGRVGIIAEERINVMGAASPSAIRSAQLARV